MTEETVKELREKFVKEQNKEANAREVTTSRNFDFMGGKPKDKVEMSVSSDVPDSVMSPKKQIKKKTENIPW